MENNNSQEKKTVIEYLGGKTIVLIIAGAVMGVFLIASIITAVTKPAVTASETSAPATAETTVETTIETTIETTPAATTVETTVQTVSETVESIAETEGSDQAETEQTETEESDNGGPATLGQLDAEAAAELYLSVMPFSERDLREQLEFDGYNTSEIDYAIANCGADWNEQAASMARLYSLGVLSRSDMIEFLEDDGFTTEQAEYGATAAGF